MWFFNGKNKRAVAAAAGVVMTLALSACGPSDSSAARDISPVLPKGMPLEQLTLELVDRLLDAKSVKDVVLWKLDSTCTISYSADVQAAGPDENAQIQVVMDQTTKVSEAVQANPKAAAKLAQHDPVNETSATLAALHEQPNWDPSVGIHDPCAAASYLRSLPDGKAPWEPGAFEMPTADTLPRGLSLSAVKGKARQIAAHEQGRSDMAAFSPMVMCMVARGADVQDLWAKRGQPGDYGVSVTGHPLDAQEAAFNLLNQQTAKVMDSIRGGSNAYLLSVVPNDDQQAALDKLGYDRMMTDIEWACQNVRVIQANS